MKTCRMCDTPKPRDQFYGNARRKDGLQAECKECKAAYNRQHYVLNKDIYIARARKTNWQKHGLTEGEYADLLRKQDGKCHICRTEQATVIDHDHSCCSGSKSCGKCVRGVLCGPCNSGIGLLRDSVGTLLNAVDYLRMTP